MLIGYFRYCAVNINDIQAAIKHIEPAYSSIDFFPTPFAQLLTPEKPTKPKQTSSDKYQRSGLSSAISNEIAAHLEALMRVENIYRRSDLTLSTLSSIQ